MKYKFIILTLACLTSVYAFTNLGYMQSNVEATIASPSKTYSLGEVVPIQLTITNTDSKEITVSGDLNFAKMYISQDGKNYRETTNTARKRPDEVRSPIKLSSNDSILNNETILWNSDKQNVEYSWKESRVLTDYVFPKAGDYYVKAKYGLYVSSKPTFVESKPIKITITEPKNEDLEVWNRIKDRGDFAYFIQFGDLLKPYDKTEEKAKFETEVEDILIKYPNSFYVASLRQSLEKFKATEAKRCELMEKMKPKP